MTMRSKLLLIALFLIPALPAWADGAVTSPDQVVQHSAKDLLNTVSAKRDELKAHPEELYDLAQKDLLPYFDFDYASRLVLGLAWRNATAQQRKDFQDAFVHYLVHSYADGLLQGNYSDRDLEVQPWNGAVSDGRTVVKTKVLRANAQPVEVDYQMRSTPDGWKAFDVTIEGISYVLNYRNQFGPEIQAKGLDELIKRLNDESKAPPKGGSGQN
ncbi:MAG: phospholipid-binding protein MlaC [Bacillota bacterium]